MITHMIDSTDSSLHQHTSTANLIHLQLQYDKLTHDNQLIHLITYKCYNQCIINKNTNIGTIGHQLTYDTRNCIINCVTQLYNTYSTAQQSDTVDLDEI